MSIVRAKESFTYWDKNGVPRDIVAGTLIDPATSPEAYKNRDHLFEPVELHVENKTPKTSVENASAEPGEKRTVTTPARTYQRRTENKEG